MFGVSADRSPSPLPLHATARGSQGDLVLVYDYGSCCCAVLRKRFPGIACRFFPCPFPSSSSAASCPCARRCSDVLGADLVAFHS